MKEYIYTISNPRRLFRDPGPLSGVTKKKGLSVLQGHFDWERERAPASNFHTVHVSSPLCSSGEGFLSTLWSEWVGVTVSPRARMQSPVKGNYSHIQKPHWTQAKIPLMCRFLSLKSLLISLDWLSFHPAVLRENCRHPPKLTQWMHHIFQHLHHSENWGKAFFFFLSSISKSPFISADLTGNLITSLVDSSFYPFVELLPPSPP